jgi:hypothetical protein
VVTIDWASRTVPTLAIYGLRAMVIGDDVLRLAAIPSRRSLNDRFPPNFSEPEGMRDKTTTNS